MKNKFILVQTQKQIFKQLPKRVEGVEVYFVPLSPIKPNKSINKICIIKYIGYRAFQLHPPPLKGFNF